MRLFFHAQMFNVKETSVAATVKVLGNNQPVGTDVREVIVQVTGDASYPAGGYTLGTAQGMPAATTVLFATFEPAVGAAATQTWTWQYDYANNKVKIGRDTGELAAATNASAASARGVLLVR